MSFERVIIDGAASSAQSNSRFKIQDSRVEGSIRTLVTVISQDIGNSCWNTARFRESLEMGGKEANFMNLKFRVCHAFLARNFSPNVICKQGASSHCSLGFPKSILHKLKIVKAKKTVDRIK